MRSLRLALAALAAALLAAAGAAVAQEGDKLSFFRIGTGPTGETHFPLGGVIASAISNPPGSRECEKGGSCGVPGLIAVAQSTNGALANIAGIAAGTLDAALVHADVAYWAFHGTGPYQGKGAVENLRAVAMLYVDSMHLVARADSGIAAVGDLKGKRVSLGGPDSGTLIDSRLVLKTHRLDEKDLQAAYLKPGQAADALAAGEIDAFFAIDAPPAPAVAELARRVPISLVPIAGPEAETLRAEYPFFAAGTIPAGIYEGIAEPVATLDLGVVLLVGAQVPDQLVYGIARALWHASTQQLLKRGHPRGKLVQLEAAAERVGLQLHGGAAAYYFDAGMVR